MPAITQFSGALASQTALKKENYLVRQETFSLNANTNKLFNVATLLGAAEAAKFDLSTIQVELFTIDTEAGSPTNGFYVPGDNAAYIGFKVTGEVFIRNNYTTALDFLIRIRVTRKADQ